MSGHTPGPWWRSGDRFRVFSGAQDGTGPIKLVAQTAFNAKERTLEAEADARLIAAAPTMHAALLDCIAALERNHPDSTVNRRAAAANARAAIAKAEGR